MVSSSGSAKSLSESRAEAIQALLDSLSPSGGASDGERLKPDQTRRISDKLGELLGENALPDMERRNEKGELLNEEGLPIIDIVEPVPDGPPPVALPLALDDADLIPMWAVSPAEKERRRADRDRILDALEQEELIEQQKEAAEEQERYKADLEKRKKAADVDIDALKRAREMQKKMGRALLRNLAEAREREEKEKGELEEADIQAREERKKLKPRKSVSFADLPVDHEHQPANSVPSLSGDWGDGPPAKDTITKGGADRGPMRMNVIERIPGLLRGPKSPPPPTQVDSDDESDPGSPVPTDSDDGDIDIVHSDHSDGNHSPPPHCLADTDESDYAMPMLEDSEPIAWDDEGYSFAQHQREIALAYYEKRATVGAEALAAMRNHEHLEDENEGEWDQPEVPLDATLSTPPPKPSVSRFKASLSSSLPSTSLGASVLPASQSSTLKSAVRLGKFENGKLAGGEEGESDDDLDPAAKEVLEILKKGDAVNVGPTIPPNASTEAPVTTSITPRGSTTNTSTSTTTSPPAVSVPKPSKASRFKMAMTQASTSSDDLIFPGSGLPTPVSTVDRSSPKLLSRTGTPISVPSRTPRLGPTQKAPESQPVQMPSMIVDSPSFPAPGIVASPSFPCSPDPAAFQSRIIESPSCQSPSSTPVVTPAGTTPAIPSGIITPLSASVLERRPIVASEVQESFSSSRSNGSAPVKDRKMSRFLAERS